MFVRIAPVLAVSSFAIIACSTMVQAATVSSFGGASSWQAVDVRPGGSAEVVDLSGLGSPLEPAPLGTGAAKLTANATNDAKAEVGIVGNFGTIGDFLSGGALSYDYFKSSAGDLNPFAAASIKFTVSDSDTASSDGYASFVYEPTWNQGSGGSDAVPTDSWLTAAVDGITGLFWHTGIYGAPNGAGGAVLNTLDGWNTFFSGDLFSAVIIGISVGVGTYNQGQTAYFDNVSFSNGDISETYDFEVAAVPGPAALPLLLSGLGVIGVMAWRKKTSAVA